MKYEVEKLHPIITECVFLSPTGSSKTNSQITKTFAANYVPLISS
jgi:hypothetical protein